MCFGVSKSGSPKLKSATSMPAAFNCLALAPAARVADGLTDSASLEVRIIAELVTPLDRGVKANHEHRISFAPMPLHVAHFIHRYPPAVGGAEAYFARLSDYLVGCGD